MGLAYEILNRMEEAIAWWKRALEINPNEGTALELLCHHYYQEATKYYQRRWYDRALVCLDELLNYKPTDYRAISLKGAVYLHKNKPRKAKEMFDKSLELAAHNPQIYLQIGSIMLEVQRLRQAEVYFAKAQECHSDKYPLSEILMRIGYLYYQFRGSYFDEQARAYFYRAIDIGGYDIALEIAEFLLDMESGDTMEFASIAHQMRPKDPSPLLLMVIYNVKRGNLQKVSEILERAENTPDYKQNPEMRSFVNNMLRLRSVWHNLDY